MERVEATCGTWRRRLVGFCREELLRHVPGEVFFPGLSALPSAAVSAIPAVETA